jgi:hypothetical protein
VTLLVGVTEADVVGVVDIVRVGVTEADVVGVGLDVGEVVAVIVPHGEAVGEAVTGACSCSRYIGVGSALIEICEALPTGDLVTGDAVAIEAEGASD